MKDKKMLGQFFTITNPFEVEPFKMWMNSIGIADETVFLEPFAGANNIVNMIQEMGYKNTWDCYDIVPKNELNKSKFHIEQRDTLKRFPKNYKIAITNPPYLAKNSATRSGIKYPNTKYQDLYLYSLDKMIKNVDYCAAIIPESFITSPIFINRLMIVVSLTCKMFDDTDCPVCLAMFSPMKDKKKFDLLKDDFLIYSMNQRIGTYNELKKNILKNNEVNIKWVFNDPNGNIGLKGIDNTKCASIKFVKGDEINPNRIKVSSRSLTRISGLPQEYDIDVFINLLNKNLNDYRNITHDVFLTAFKNLRSDNKYRRRLDFDTARYILNVTLLEMEKLV